MFGVFIFSVEDSGREVEGVILGSRMRTSPCQCCLSWCFSCSHVKNMPQSNSELLSLCHFALLCSFSESVLLKILLGSVAPFFPKSPCWFMQRTFCFSLPGTQWHSSLLSSLDNAEWDRTYGPEVVVDTRYGHWSSRGEDVSHWDQNRGFGFLFKIPTMRQWYSRHCYCTRHPRIILFLICSFPRLSPPLFKCLTWYERS